MGGAVAVPADKLYSVVKAAPGDDITLQACENFRLTVTSGAYHTEIACMDPADFPPLSEPDGSPDIEFSAAPFQAMIAANLHAVGNDPQKTTLAGLHLKKEKDLLVGTATDGHRLSLAGKRIGEEVFISSDMFDAGVTIPRKGLEEIKKLTCGSVYIWHTDNSLMFSQTGITLIIRLIEGDFPDYRRVIPTEHPHRFIVNSGNLAAAVERVNILGDRKSIRLAYEFGGCCLEISTESVAGEASDHVDLVEWEGPEDFSIILDPKYLLEALASIGEDDVFIKFKDDINPLVLFPSDHEKWDERLLLLLPRHA